ncbi:MAG: DUF6067 family protein [Caldilineaceae bacterium]
MIQAANTVWSVRPSGERVLPALEPQGKFTLQRAPAQPLQVWVADALTRIGPQMAARPKSRAFLQAARNEYEPFQVVVTAQGQTVTNVRAALSSFRGKGGVIAQSYATLYREHYVAVKKPSPLSPLAPAWVADALIPFTEPETGAALTGPVYRAEPFTVTVGYSQPLWVDVFVPKETAAGVYTATLTITADHAWSATVPVTLTVWNFTLPQTPYQHSAFGLSPAMLRWYYQLDAEQEPARYNVLLRRYNLMLLQHRLMPTNLPAADYALDKKTGKVTFPAWITPGLGINAADNLHYYLNTVGMNAVEIPLSAKAPFPDPLGQQRTQVKRYLGSMAQSFRQENSRILIYVYPIDEPDSAAAYRAVRQWAALVHEANQEYGVDIKLLLTEQPAPQQSSWGSLAGSVDIWAPCCGKVWQDLAAPDGQRLLSKRLGQHEAVWWYTALVQPPDEWMAQQGWPDVLTDHYTPIWLLDYPPMNYRISSWLNQLYGFTGLLYWNTNQWQAAGDVWKNPATYLDDEHWFNGEGLLLYPGAQATIGFDGPVASLRLKWLRDSMDDYDYLEMLKAHGQAAYVRTQLHTLVRGMDDWAMDPSVLYTVRQNLGEKLSAVCAKPHVCNEN